MCICPVYATRFTIMFCYVSYHFFIYVEPFEFLIFHAVFTCCFIFSPNEGFLLFLLLSRDHGNFFSVCVCAYFVIYLMEWTLILDTRCDNNRVYSYFFFIFCCRWCCHCWCYCPTIRFHFHYKSCVDFICLFVILLLPSPAYMFERNGKQSIAYFANVKFCDHTVLQDQLMSSYKFSLCFCLVNIDRPKIW